jgi:hypothetical protein
MILTESDKLNLVDTLKEWEECVGFKEMDEADVGLDHDRYVNLMRRLGETEIENNFSWETGSEQERLYIGIYRKLVSHGIDKQHSCELMPIIDKFIEHVFEWHNADMEKNK